MIRLGHGWYEDYTDEPIDELQKFSIRELRNKLDYIWEKFKQLSEKERDARSIKGKKI
jgi:hypothetical protein